MNACPRRKSGFRPPTPRGNSRVYFRALEVEDEPRTSGREGDVGNDPDVLAVDEYMTSILSLDPTAEYAVESDDEFDEEFLEY